MALQSTAWARQLCPRPIRPVGFDLLSLLTLLNAAPLTPPPKVLIALGLKSTAHVVADLGPRKSRLRTGRLADNLNPQRSGS
jgi:hypothetical protein